MANRKPFEVGDSVRLISDTGPFHKKGMIATITVVQENYTAWAIKDCECDHLSIDNSCNGSIDMWLHMNIELIPSIRGNRFSNLQLED